MGNRPIEKRKRKIENGTFGSRSIHRGTGGKRAAQNEVPPRGDFSFGLRRACEQGAHRREDHLPAPPPGAVPRRAESRVLAEKRGAHLGDRGGEGDARHPAAHEGSGQGP